MSTKGTVFLTKDNEHCYDETFEKDGNSFRLYLEIDFNNIKSISFDETDGLIVGIKGDSEMANVLRDRGYKAEGKK
jgi:hypothetical protein